MSDTDQKKEEDKFNETLKRMLETPPKPRDKPEHNTKKGDKSNGARD
ncbi:MAG: hypothetical protein WBO55_11785 [Rhizobiaceae bacterium]